MATLIHRFLRAIFRAYPFRTPAYELNRILAFVFDRKQPQWLLADGYGGTPRMELNVSDRFQRKLYYFPVAYQRFWWGLPLASYLRQRLRPGDVFIDIGSNVGYYTLLAADLVGPTGAVTAFEPDPNVFESLQRSAAANGYQHVTCCNVALSNQPGQLHLHRARETAHSLSHGTTDDPEYHGSVAVEVTTFDAYLANAGAMPAVRAIKMDVEGEEVRAVEGMLASLPKIGYPPIWAEVRGPEGSDRAPDTFAPTLAHLRPLGYRAYRWQPGGPVEVGEADVKGQEDILFARSLD